MKKSNLSLALAAISLGALSLTSCGEKTVNLTGAYLSPAVLSYINVRPEFNYYMTTFTFQELETYDDNTYVLTVSSSMFSGLVLPDVGNDATGNERENSMKKYFGTYTAKDDDLDPGTLNITLSTPTRYVNVFDSLMYYDTANWTDAMAQAAGKKAEGSEEVTPCTAEEYLAAVAFKETVISVTKETYSFTYTDLVVE